MSKFKTIGKWVALQTEGLGKEKTTESGIIYKEKITIPTFGAGLLVSVTRSPRILKLAIWCFGT
jgi:hypothetical protein